MNAYSYATIHSKTGMQCNAVQCSAWQWRRAKRSRCVDAVEPIGRAEALAPADEGVSKWNGPLQINNCQWLVGGFSFSPRFKKPRVAPAALIGPRSADP